MSAAQRHDAIKRPGRKQFCSLGCANRNQRVDLSGRRFGKLLVIAYSHETRDKHNVNIYWSWECDCGERGVSRYSSLITRKKTCCRACSNAAAALKRTIHGYAKKDRSYSMYTSWVGMRQRCSNPNNQAFENYGGRGIRVCAEWDSFDRFLRDVGPSPGAGFSLDRINNSGNYEPGNVRWATKKEQQRNRRQPVTQAAYLKLLKENEELNRQLSARRIRRVRRDDPRLADFQLRLPIALPNPSSLSASL